MNDNVITHVFCHYIGEKNKGGIGVAAWHRQGDSFVRVATAICSSADQYSKKTAVKMLTVNQIDSKYICLPIGESGVKDMTHRDLRDIVDSRFA